MLLCSCFVRAESPRTLSLTRRWTSGVTARSFLPASEPASNAVAVSASGNGKLAALTSDAGRAGCLMRMALPAAGSRSRTMGWIDTRNETRPFLQSWHFSPSRANMGYPDSAPPLGQWLVGDIAIGTTWSGIAAAKGATP